METMTVYTLTYMFADANDIHASDAKVSVYATRELAERCMREEFDSAIDEYNDEESSSTPVIYSSFDGNRAEVRCGSEKDETDCLLLWRVNEKAVRTDT